MWSKAWVCVLSIAAIAGSNLDGSMDVGWSLVFVVLMSLRGADNSFRRVLPEREGENVCVCV
jgi:hypothetical protein